MPVVFDVRLQDPATVLGGSSLGCDGSGVSQIVRKHVANTARRIVERHHLNSGVGAEKITALIKSYRMREDSLNILEPGSRSGDQVMPDPQMQLAVDVDIAGQKKIVVLGNRTGERVFNRDDRSLHGPGFNCIEHFRRTRTGKDNRLG